VPTDDSASFPFLFKTFTRRLSAIGSESNRSRSYKQTSHHTKVLCLLASMRPAPHLSLLHFHVENAIDILLFHMQVLNDPIGDANECSAAQHEDT
jgi:hypothetical protein